MLIPTCQPPKPASYFVLYHTLNANFLQELSMIDLSLCHFPFFLYRRLTSEVHRPLHSTFSLQDHQEPLSAFPNLYFFSGLILYDLSKTFHPVNTPWYFRLSTLDHHSLLAALLCLWPHLGVFQYLFFYYLSFRCSMGFSLPPSLSFYIISATPRFRHHLLMVVYLYIYLAASPSRAPDIHFWIQLKRCHDDVPHSLI